MYTEIEIKATSQKIILRCGCFFRPLSLKLTGIDVQTPTAVLRCLAGVNLVFLIASIVFPFLKVILFVDFFVILSAHHKRHRKNPYIAQVGQWKNALLCS